MELPLPGLRAGVGRRPRVQPAHPDGHCGFRGRRTLDADQRFARSCRPDPGDARFAPANGLRGSPIDAVVLTGAEIDQIAGLLSLRESTAFTLYATPASHAAVESNAMFGAMNAMTRRAINPGERFTLSGGIEATMFMVPGKLPLYLEGETPELDAESPVNVGVELHRDGASVVFVPGAAR